MSASGKKVRAFSQSATQKARMQVSLLSIGSIYCVGMQIFAATQSTVGAGLRAMQTPRFVRLTEVMLSLASQLPQ
ncbi:hypothetical protein, partial [Pseudomonas sp. GM24]|uniref:hypothetical protein n=1 Tax=Pseudomonas sp. GM24 TaxID=1144326 RepID=UPI001EE677CF